MIFCRFHFLCAVGIAASSLAGQIVLQPPGEANVECSVPPSLDPSDDGLPSAEALFSGPDALELQVKRHQAVVRIPTISYDDSGTLEDDERWETFRTLHKVFADLYPTLHKRAKLEKVNQLGLVFTIAGSDETLQPAVLTGHQDVVPVADPRTWTYPPFEAYYDGTWLWGRGAKDDKNSISAIMSAADTLLANPDWKPARTIILAFGFDEEVSGHRGAEKISEFLQRRYGENGASFVLDEGGVGLIQEEDILFAVPTVYEKGYANIRFDLSIVGGHSSEPPPHTGIGIMAELVTAVEAHPFKAQLVPGSVLHKELLCQTHFSPNTQPKLADLLSRGDLEGASEYLVNKSTASQYLIQTAQSVNYFRGGQKFNAMPESIEVGINYRIAEPDNIESVKKKLLDITTNITAKYGIRLHAFEHDQPFNASQTHDLVDDSFTQISQSTYNGTLAIGAEEVYEASYNSPASGPAWDTFAGTIIHTFSSNGRVIPIGSMGNGNSDLRHYTKLSQHIYGFLPMREGDFKNRHATDERVRMDNHMEMLRFYYNLLRNLSK